MVNATSYHDRLSCEHDLYAHKSTLECVKNGCLSCLYKISPIGDFGDSYAIPSNIRPELCLRSKDRVYNGIYQCSDQSIMTCGDGDFSFTLSLCKYSNRKEVNGASDDRQSILIGTSHESYESVISTYPSSSQILSELKEEQKITVLHDVDATNLASNAYIHTNLLNRIDVVIWNFPCIRVDEGRDGQTNALQENQELLRKFFINISAYLKTNDGNSNDGCTSEVHVTHKTIEPFCWWGIVDIAKANGFIVKGLIIFDRYNYPGYINRKVLDKKSFPLHDAITYVFSPIISSSSSSSGSTTSGSLYNSDRLVLYNSEYCQSIITQAIEVYRKKPALKDKNGDATVKKKRRMK